MGGKRNISRCSVLSWSPSIGIVRTVLFTGRMHISSPH